jgi:pimeloyl-ACP methyl ester carboxylesterase
MSLTAPFYRESGDGPGVVCIHSNAASGAQWRALTDLLLPRYRVIAPDSWGSGKSPDWPSDRVIHLRDEVEFMAPVMERAGAAPVLVGHSYGAAVALVAALARPGGVRALALYEPTLFSLIDAHTPRPNDADGIRGAVACAAAALDAGDPAAAAGHFIDYWMGPDSWRRIPEARQGPIAASMLNVRRWAHALFNEPTPLDAFRTLDVPVLYMVGTHSPASALGVARLLAPVLPQVEMVELDGLGHMGPLTHPQVVNDAIARFLDRIDPP